MEKNSVGWIGPLPTPYLKGEESVKKRVGKLEEINGVTKPGKARVEYTREI